MLHIRICKRNRSTHMAIFKRLFWLLVSFIFAAAAVLLYLSVTKGLFAWIPR